MAFIEFENVTYAYGEAPAAIDGVNLQIEAGTFTCILGSNGSGKSTLAKLMNGLLVPADGAVRIDGRLTSDRESLSHVRSTVGMVFQNPDDQIVASIVEDEVAFGPENLGVPHPDLRQRVTEALGQVGLQGFEKRGTHTLSGGQKQRLAIAGVLAMRPKALVLDEASSMLDPRGREQLALTCSSLHEAGMTIVAITHFMEEALRADRVLVLDAGRIAADGSPEDVLADYELLERLGLREPKTVQLCRLLADRGAGWDVRVREEDVADMLAARAKHEAPSGRDAEPSVVAPEQGKVPEAEELIRVEGVCFTYQSDQERKDRRRTASSDRERREDWAVHDIDLAVAGGESLGIAGPSGSGKSTLIQLVSGLLKPTCGRVLLRGRDVADKQAMRDLRSTVGVAFQYPEHQLFAATVFDDVAFGPRNFGIEGRELELRVREALDMVHLDYDVVGPASPFALSGGQQRRVALAGVLATRPKLLVLDEPTAGLDPREHDRLIGLIAEMRDRNGLSVIMASHDMDDLARQCDRVLVLDKGAVRSIGKPADVLTDEAALRGIGLDAPFAVRMANRLASHGVSIGSPKPLTVEQLAERFAYSKS